MKTVVIVDDEPITRMDLSDMLQELGFEIAGETADGFDAVELCRTVRPDVVLMDVKMPIFDGLTASETILSESLAGCVVLLTAFNDRAVIERASKAGVTGYLVKPIDQKSLLPTIEVAYAQSQRLVQSRQETQAAQKKIQEDRLIHKAQQYLAKMQGCSEPDAYRQMRKTAMDKRISLAVLAEHVLQQAARNDHTGPAKQLLIEKMGMSEDRAYQHIVSYSKARSCSVEEAAKEIRIALERK